MSFHVGYFFLLTVRLIKYTKQLDFIDGKKREITSKSSFFFSALIIYEIRNFCIIRIR